MFRKIVKKRTAQTAVCIWLEFSTAIDLVLDLQTDQLHTVQYQFGADGRIRCPFLFMVQQRLGDAL